eukprot:TRINITY_DN33237_c0_g1_i1.p2 TRINITY_DN33237_c0_g1~~TRINITY_DN33237_c0_g1_i1.p2  ORF type:complete len:131 (+),score=16.74 TRINITY_DN33237_c0_g1_i1:47-439(+)
MRTLVFVGLCAALVAGEDGCAADECRTCSGECVKGKLHTCDKELDYNSRCSLVPCGAQHGSGLVCDFNYCNGCNTCCVPGCPSLPPRWLQMLGPNACEMLWPNKEFPGCRLNKLVPWDKDCACGCHAPGA